MQVAACDGATAHCRFCFIALVFWLLPLPRALCTSAISKSHCYSRSLVSKRLTWGMNLHVPLCVHHLFQALLWTLHVASGIRYLEPQRKLSCKSAALSAVLAQARANLCALTGWLCWPGRFKLMSLPCGCCQLLIWHHSSVAAVVLTGPYVDGQPQWCLEARCSCYGIPKHIL